jgi:hypothetical protein
MCGSGCVTPSRPACYFFRLPLSLESALKLPSTLDVGIGSESDAERSHFWSFGNRRPLASNKQLTWLGPRNTCVSFRRTQIHLDLSIVYLNRFRNNSTG